MLLKAGTSEVTTGSCRQSRSFFVCVTELSCLQCPCPHKRPLTAAVIVHHSEDAKRGLPYRSLQPLFVQTWELDTVIIRLVLSTLLSRRMQLAHSVCLLLNCTRCGGLSPNKGETNKNKKAETCPAGRHTLHLRFGSIQSSDDTSICTEKRHAVRSMAAVRDAGRWIVRERIQCINTFLLTATHLSPLRHRRDPCSYAYVMFDHSFWKRYSFFFLSVLAFSLLFLKDANVCELLPWHTLPKASCRSPIIWCLIHVITLLRNTSISSAETKASAWHEHLMLITSEDFI